LISFLYKSINRYQLTGFSEPLAQLQSNWRAFRPEPVVRIENL
jgi:hypothetical protein